MAVQISGNDITVPRDGTFSRNVSIAGTLTYEDVTNIDSVGLITARQGIEVGASPGVGASISVDGNAIFSGITTATTLRAPTGIVTTLTTNTLTANSTTKVGSGVTLSPDGDVFVTGISTLGEGAVIKNTTAGDGDGDRSSFIKFQGTQSGGEVSDLVHIGALHDGTGDNQQGAFRVYVNDGDDNAAPTERFGIGQGGEFRLSGANIGSSGQVLTSQGSGSPVHWATPSTPITTSVNAGPLSGATNYDFTLPSNCYKVEFVGHNISTSGSGTPSFRAGTSGGILSSGNYTFTDSGWHSGRDQIDFADANMNAAGDTGDFIVSFYSSSSSDMWIFEGKAVRRTQGSIIHVLGMLDLGGAALTTLRFYPEGTGFDTGRIRWTGYSY